MNEFGDQIGGDLGNSIFDFINQIGANSEGVLGYDSELQILKDQVAPIISVEYFSSNNTLVLTNTAGYDHIIELNDITMTPEELKDLEDIRSQLQDLKGKVNSISSDVDELKSAGYQTADQVDARIKEVIGAAPEALDTLQEIAKALDDDPDFAGTITNELATKATKDDINALKSEVNLKANKTEIPSLTGYATEEWVEGKNYLTEHQDISDLATKEELNKEVAARSAADTQLQSDIQSEATTARAAEKEISDKVTSLESEVSIKANQADVDAQVNIINSTTQKLQEDLSYVSDTVIPQMNENTAKALEQKVTWEMGTKIQLPLAEGSVSGIINAGTPESPEAGDGAQLLGLSKWNKVEVGSSKVQLNLNGPKGEDDRPTYNDDFKIALQKDIPDVSSLATKSELTKVEGKIPSVDGYATQEWVGKQGFLTEHQDISGLATKEDLNSKADSSVVTKLQSDLTNVADVIIPEMNTNTAKGLDSKVSWDQSKKVISLPMNGSISALRESNPEEGTQPEGGVLLAQRTYDSGVTLVTEVGTTKNKLTLNASERPQVDIKDAGSEQVAYLSDVSESKAEVIGSDNDLSEASTIFAAKKYAQELVNSLRIPVDADIPVRTILDKVYTKEEILGWFNATSDAELKEIISYRPVFCRMDVTYSALPHIYRMPIQYLAYESAAQIKFVILGLDTSNDNPVKYEIVANLDETIIEGSSNVKVTKTEFTMA